MTFWDINTFSKLTQIRNKMKIEQGKDVKENKIWLDKSDLWEVPSFWPSTVTKLYDSWIYSQRKLLNADKVNIKKTLDNELQYKFYIKFLENNNKATWQQSK